MKNKMDIPTYEEIIRSTNKEEYKGYLFQRHLTENLYFVIEILNENVIFPNYGESVIEFSFCTKNFFSIAKVRYINCKEGYLAGIAHMIGFADTFQDVFANCSKNLKAHIREGE